MSVWDTSSVAALRMFSSTLSISSPPWPITWLILCFAIVPHCWVLSWGFWWDQAQLSLVGLLRLYQRRQNHTSSKNCLIGFCVSIFFFDSSVSFFFDVAVSWLTLIFLPCLIAKNLIGLFFLITMLLNTCLFKIFTQLLCGMPAIVSTSSCLNIEVE